MRVNLTEHDLIMSLMRCINPGPIFYGAVSFNFGDWNKDSPWDFMTSQHPSSNCITPHNFSKQDIEVVKNI